MILSIHSRKMYNADINEASSIKFFAVLGSYREVHIFTDEGPVLRS